ncbi:MAG: hypothetical protein WCG44_00240 [bacterium]
MKLFWTASYSGKHKYQADYDLVSRAIDQAGDLEVVSPEKGNYQSLLPPKVKVSLGSEPTKLHYEAIRRGILWADAVIIEVSEEDFQLGHEATLAIQSKKHVLCLSTHNDFSNKISNRYFHAARYNKMTINQIIEDFLALAQKDLLSQRFNLFLTSSQIQFLKTKGLESGLGASDYLRSLIDSAKSSK